MILEVDNLQIHYSTRDGTARAVDGASFVVPEGRIVGLVGESGCGKTTAVRAIMGVLAENGRQAGGRVVFKGQALDDDVERRHRLVGQQQAGLERERNGDGGALAHAAGELVRIVGQPPLAQAHQLEQLD